MTVVFGSAPRASGAMYANTGMEFFAPGASPVGFYDVADVAGLEGALRRARR